MQRTWAGRANREKDKTRKERAPKANRALLARRDLAPQAETGSGRIGIGRENGVVYIDHLHAVRQGRGRMLVNSLGRTY